MAAPAYVGSVSGGSTSDNLFHEVSLPTHSEGDIVLVAIGNTKGSTDPSPTYTTPTDWTQIYHENVSAASAVRFAVYIRKAPAGGISSPMEFDASSNSGWVYVAIAYSDAEETPNVISSFNTGSDGTAISPAVTTTANDCRVIRIAMNDDDDMTDPDSYPSGITQRNIYYQGTPGNGLSVGVADEELSAAGSTGAASWTLDAAEEWGAVTIALEPTSAGPAELTIQDASHSLTSDNVTLSTEGTVSLVIDDALHSQSADNITLQTSEEMEADWYVSPSGSSGGYGTYASPWDIVTALTDGGNQYGTVQPGDVIALMDGTYGSGGDNVCEVNIEGTSANKIVVRPYEGAHVKINGGFHFVGEHVRFTNAEGCEFEVHNTYWQSTSRYYGNGYTGPKEAFKVSDETGGGIGIEIINIIMHDCKQGVANQDEGTGGLMYGNLIYNCGYQRDDRGHGHGFYLQNPHTTLKEIKETVSCHSFSKGGQIYGDSADLKNIHVKGIVFVNADFVWYGSGAISNAKLEESTIRGKWCADLYAGNYWMEHEDIYFVNNKLWTLESGRYPVQFGPYDSLTFTGNRLVNTATLPIIEYKVPSSGTEFPGTWNNNSYYGNGAGGEFTEWAKGDTQTRIDYDFSGWKSRSGYDSSSTYTNGTPTGVEVEVRPNAYETGRGNIIVHNWDEDNYVDVDLSSLGMNTGDQYEIYNVLNYFGDTPQSGTYNASSPTIQLDMQASRWTYVRPYGGSDSTRNGWSNDDWGDYAHAPWPTFGVFIIRRVSVSGTPGLTIHDATHQQTVDQVALTQEHFLAINDAIHSLQSDTISFTETIELSIDDAYHYHYSDEPTLEEITPEDLIIDSAYHYHFADEITLEEVAPGVLTIASAIHLHKATNVRLVLSARPKGDVRSWTVIPYNIVVFVDKVQLSVTMEDVSIYKVMIEAE